jgi:tRNA pseudouridine65 synthase
LRHTRPVPADLARFLGRGVREVWRDDDLWLLDKPPGILSHPNPPAKTAGNALLRGEYDMDRELYRLRREGEPVARVWLVHRLDRETSGLILCALTQDGAARVKEALERREVQKEYRALVLGIPEKPKGEWRDHLERRRREGRVEVAAVGGAPPNATTRYEIVTRFSAAGLALLSLAPREGRTHQLRVQCARHGHPIAGDDRYGDFSANRELARTSGLSRMFLVAHRLELAHPRTGKRLRFEAELRPELAKVLRAVESATPRRPRAKPPTRAPRRRV